MVAVALMPPLVVAGLMLGAGHFDQAVGAAELLAVNVVCVNLASVATFWIQKVVPARYWQAARARTATRRAILVWVSLLVALLAWVLLNAEPLERRYSEGRPLCPVSPGKTVAAQRREPRRWVRIAACASPSSSSPLFC
jgi:uncharacterized membrane protein